MSVTIKSLQQPLLLSVYKFLETSDINNITLSSKHLKNSTSSDPLWKYLVKRDLTEREHELVGGDSYKQIYMNGKPFLNEISNAISDLEKFEILDEKDSEVFLGEDAEQYVLLQNVYEDRFQLLHHAARLGYEKCIDIIMSKLKVGVDEHDEGGITALCLAAQSDQVHCLEKLLSLGADINIRDETGGTPLGYAVIYGSVKSVDFLLKRGANVENIGEREFRMLDDLNNCGIEIKQEINALIMAYTQTVFRSRQPHS